jgi:nucleotide-binding universal stress UspA family protein
MFKHVLIPTDGSAIANRAAKAGLRFARSIGARVTGYYAIELVHPQVYSEGYIPDERTLAMWDRKAKAFGDRHLAAMARLAKTARVRFDSVCAKAPTPYGGIIATARRKKCDVIFMASHGRSGIARLVMGSVTDKVLKLSKIPVVVYR